MAAGLENLEIYMVAKELEDQVYKLCENFPPEEKFGKTSQLKRSTSSVTDNIAESYGRFGYQDKIQFLYISRGSAEEARSQLERSKKIVSKNQHIQIDDLIDQYSSEIKRINGFIQYLKTKKLGIS